MTQSDSEHNQHETTNSPPHDLARSIRVAIVGSGPSGFYAAGALFKSDLNVEVVMFEKLPKPYGLVQFGVAPDHAKIRKVTQIYDKTANDQRFKFYGNVNIGKDLTIAELKEFFDATILAFGSAKDRRMKIEGEDLERSYSATSFCAWYNGHPDYRNEQFDLSQDTAVVVGQGNVAMDVARILAKPADELKNTDMATHAVEALSKSKIKDVFVIGRRGPAQAAFTPKEITELGEITDCDLIIKPGDMTLSELSQAELELPDKSANARNVEILREFAKRPLKNAPRRIHLIFHQSTKKIIEKDGAVAGIGLERNELHGKPGSLKAHGTGLTTTLPCGIVFRSIGYKGVGLPGVPFDDNWGVVPNTKGKVHEGLYAAGWIKRGPSGLIGTNKKCSEETVEELIKDLDELTYSNHQNLNQLDTLLNQRNIRVVSFADWQQIDAAEIANGEKIGKPREHFTRIEEMLSVLA